MNNFAENIHPVEYYAIHGDWGEPPSPKHFQHDPAAGRPKLPDFSGLERVERETIENWIAHYDIGSMDVVPIDLHKPAQRMDGEGELSEDAKKVVDQIAKVITMPAYGQWKLDNIAKRKSEWRWRSAAAHHEAGLSVMQKFKV